MSGYNTMSAEKKKNVDIESVANIMQKGLIITGATTTISSIALFWLKLPTLATIALIAPLLFGVLILIILTQKYDLNKKSKFKKSFPIIFISLIIIIVASFIWNWLLPTKVNMSDSAIEFTGQYGVTVQYSQIDKVELLGTIPAIKMRTNGLGLGNILKGHFLLNEFGKCRLFVKLPNPPYLYIGTKNGATIIFNSEDSTYTDQIYRNLSKIIHN